MSPRAWRIAAGLSQAAAADRLGCDRQTLARIEAGRIPQPWLVRRYFETSGGAVRPDDLFPLAAWRAAGPVIMVIAA